MNRRPGSNMAAAASLRRGPHAEWRWAVVAAYMLAIFFASAQSDVSMPGGVSDKAAHGFAYSGLSVLIVWALVRGEWRRTILRTVLTATLLSAAYGLSDETHQLFVPRRSFDWYDLRADATGAFVAASAAWAWGILLRWSTRDHGV